MARFAPGTTFKQMLVMLSLELARCLYEALIVVHWWRWYVTPHIPDRWGMPFLAAFWFCSILGVLVKRVDLVEDVTTVKKQLTAWPLLILTHALLWLCTII